ncbi:MAG: hypothetical protein QW767_01825 [Thermoprotei archaeon]
MERKACLLILVLAIGGTVGLIGPYVGNVQGASANFSLQLSAVPPTLPSGGGTYPSIVVSLVSSNGEPYVGLNSTTVYLSSSNTGVGYTPSKILIPAGNSFAVVNFTTTQLAGTTILTASAQGTPTVSTQVTTVEPSGYPAALKVYASPSERLAGERDYGSLVIELVDQTGLPAKAVANTPVTIASSQTSVVNPVESQVTITEGSIMYVASYSSGMFPGQAVVTASASGYLSGSATINVVGPSPLKLNVQVDPSPLPAQSRGYLAVWLSDKQGNPAVAPTYIKVTITSSNLSVADSSAQSLTISPGESSANVSVQASEDGTAIFTASSKGLISGFTDVKVTAAENPTGLTVTMAPNITSADNTTSYSVIVSLNNGQHPSVAQSPILVYLTSSNTSVAGVQSSAVINKGDSFCVASIKSTYSPGTTEITASAQNLVSGKALAVTFAPVPAQLSVTPTPSILPSDGGVYRSLLITLQTVDGGTAIAPTPITVSLFSSDTDVASVNSTVTVPAGSSSVLTWVKTTLTPGKTTITVLASGYTSSSAELSTVTPGATQLAVYTAPTTGFTGEFGGVYVAIQAQNSQGNPVQLRYPTQVMVFSSNSNIIPKPVQLTIPQEGDMVGLIIHGAAAGQFTLSATSQGLAIGTASATISGYPVSYSLTLSSIIAKPGQALGATLTVTLDGQPVPGANVSWVSQNGALTSMTGSTNSAGEAFATLVPTSVGSASLTAVVYQGITGRFNVTQYVSVALPRPPPSPLKRLLEFPLVIGLVAVPVGVASGVIVVLKKRKGDDEGSEGSFEI